MRLKNTYKASGKGKIVDERLPKQAVSAYVLFSKSRWQSGNFAGQRPADAAKTIADEWKALSDAERQVRVAWSCVDACDADSWQPFFDSAEADRARYANEVRSTLGREVKQKRAPST
jgi:hypothetical protein